MNALTFLKSSWSLPSQELTTSERLSGIPSKVMSISQRIFCELTCALAINAASIIFFHATMMGFSVMSTLVVCSIIGIALESLIKPPLSDIQSSVVQATAQKIARLSMVNALWAYRPTFWIHEYGHYWAAKACFIKASPNVVVFPMKYASTNYFVSYGLTGFGQLLGKSDAKLFTTAAGLLSSALFAIAAYAAAYRMQKKHPHISEFLNYQATTQLLSDILYGIQALTLKRPSLIHDFIRLKARGIHPLVVIGLLTTIATVQFFLLLRQHNKQDSH